MSTTTGSRRALAGTLGCGVALAALVACSGGSSTPASSSPPSSTDRSSASTAAPSGSGSGSTSTSPTAAVTSSAGNPEPSIVGAPTPASILAAGSRAVGATYTPNPSTAVDGSVGDGVEQAGGFDTGSSAVDVDYNPADHSLIAVTCLSPAPAAAPDATRAICTGLHYTGADAASARAWVAAAAAKLPAGNTTLRERNNDLNGLVWLVYRQKVEPLSITVTVSTKVLNV